MITIPRRNLAVRFQTAMGDYRHAVVTLVRHICALKPRIGIALGLLGSLLRIVGTGFFRLNVADEMRKWFVLDANRTHRIARLLFSLRRNSRDLLAAPKNLFACCPNHINGLYTRHFLSGRSINTLNRCLGVWCTQHFALQQSRQLHVVRIFHTTRRLPRTIQPRDSLANQAAFARFGPVIVGHYAPRRILFAASTVAWRTPMYVPQRQRLPPSACCTSSYVG